MVTLCGICGFRIYKTMFSRIVNMDITHTFIKHVIITISNVRMLVNKCSVNGNDSATAQTCVQNP